MKFKGVLTTLVALGLMSTGSAGYATESHLGSVPFSEILPGSDDWVGVRAGNDRYMAYIPRDHADLMLVDTQTNQTKSIYHSQYHQLYDVKMDDRYLVFGDAVGFFVYTLATGELKNIAPTGEAGSVFQIYQNQVSFRNNQYVPQSNGYTRPSEDYQLLTYDLEKRTLTQQSGLNTNSFFTIHGDWVLQFHNAGKEKFKDNRLVSYPRIVEGLNRKTNETFKTPVIEGLMGVLKLSALDSHGNLYFTHQDDFSGPSSIWKYNRKTGQVSVLVTEKSIVKEILTDEQNHLYYTVRQHDKPITYALKRIDLDQATPTPSFIGNPDGNFHELNLLNGKLYFWHDSPSRSKVTFLNYDPNGQAHDLLLFLNSPEVLGTATRGNLDVAPFLAGDRTMVPLRFISETLGGDVQWNEATQQVTIHKGDHKVVISIGSSEAWVDGQPMHLDAPALTREDRTFVPVRFIAEGLGLTVTWQDIDQAIVITDTI